MPESKCVGRTLISFAFIGLCVWSFTLHAEGCREVAHVLNRHLQPKIDDAELAEMLEALNRSGNTQLPDKFITKKQARQLGWQPGKDLWKVPALRFRSIGGDHFGNREKKLPHGDWREADLDYQGGRRGAKRLLFSRGGVRQVTVDHYQTFIEVPSCR